MSTLTATYLDQTRHSIGRAFALGTLALSAPCWTDDDESIPQVPRFEIAPIIRRTSEGQPFVEWFDAETERVARWYVSTTMEAVQRAKEPPPHRSAWTPIVRD